MKTRFGKNDEAVSPVIGVILMVAITVILAAVIAAFVFGMGPPANAPKTNLEITQASVTTGNITLVHNGGDIIDLSRTSAIIDQVNSSGKAHLVISQLNTSTSYYQVGSILTINTSQALVTLTNGTGTYNLAVGTSTGAFVLTQGQVTVTLVDTASSQLISKQTANAI